MRHLLLWFHTTCGPVFPNFWCCCLLSCLQLAYTDCLPLLSNNVWRLRLTVSRFVQFCWQRWWELFWKQSTWFIQGPYAFALLRHSKVVIKFHCWHQFDRNGWLGMLLSVDQRCPDFILLTCLIPQILQIHKSNQWIWLTLIYERAKVSLTLAAAWSRQGSNFALRANNGSFIDPWHIKRGVYSLNS